jgi:mannonate dehydratase
MTRGGSGPLLRWWPLAAPDSMAAFSGEGKGEVFMDSLSRRNLIQAAGLAALASSAASGASAPAPNQFEGKDTPKISLALGDGTAPRPAAAPAAAGAPAAGGAPGRGGPNLELEAAQAKRVRQLGVEWLHGGGGRTPWDETQLKAQMDRMKGHGLSIGNLMIGGIDNAIYNRPGKDDDIEKFIGSIRAAGKAGLPVIEYNWYAHRAMEGYFEETGRAGAGWTGFDYAKMKDLPPLEREGAHTAEEMWANITYFLKKVIPEAEKANVRLALHPNDPPAPISRGSQQIMGTLAGWKKLVDIVKSPCNGITFDCGVTREMGEDPVETCRYFASRGCINHVHFRNVKLQKPYERYSEVFIDEGDNNMFLVMRELLKAKYKLLIYPEHPRALDYDRERPGFNPQYAGGGAYAAYSFNVGYTRAMMQAALTSL